MSDTTSSPSADLAVVGGGLIGLAIADRAARAGLKTLLFEREAHLGLGASFYAAGMLAPVSEAEIGHADLLEDGLTAAAAWPAFAKELHVPLHTKGTLHVARDLDEAVALERELAFRQRRELPVERLVPSDARKLEPALAPTVRVALHIPDEHAVDPRLVLEALEQHARDAGVRIRLGAHVTGIAHGNGYAELQLAGGADGPRATHVVVACGAWSPQLMPGLQVRPVKGQILRLRDPAHETTGPLVERVLRFAGGYLVPRGDGRYVLGATVEEKGFDQTVTVGGVYELLRDATELVPGLSELVIDESGAGLRPGSPQNLPIVERRGRVLVATGHFRNGVLLAPLTAQRVVEQLTNDRGPVPA
ncbi:MAG TPA: glycine oxidase ThiO [Solirubrobacteraceae bacterium]|nr:glycine oxidase ThiO [Solirubrobacteraceae bacterium]